MLLDLESPQTPQEFTADLCIIGSGAAGISMSRRLTGTGIDVLVLEAGGMNYDPASQDIYQGRVTGLNYNLTGARLRFFGGTTNHWEGWCGPLRPVDFTARPWIPESGWPIGYDDLEPYYRAACEFLGLGDFDYDAHTAPLPAPSLTPSGIPFFDSFNIRPVPAPRLGVVHRQALTDASNIRLLLHANVQPIETEGSEIKQLTVSTLGGRRATVRARTFVLACGGLENARLLLASGGLANSSGTLGRYFMEHMFSMFAGLIIPPPELEAPGLFMERLGTPTFVGFRTSAAAQAEMGLLTCSIGMVSAPVPEEQKRTQPGMRGPACPPYITTAYPMLIHGEQTPNPDSRVTLSPDAKDAFGVPRISLHWKVDDLTQRSVRETVLRYGAMLTRAGLGRAYIPPERTELEWPFWLFPPCHPSGTTRMSDDPRRGIVNGNCRTHDIPNLYVVGSSVFATIGNMNPTMTIIALSFRLADHLRDQLARR